MMSTKVCDRCMGVKYEVIDTWWVCSQCYDVAYSLAGAVGRQEMARELLRVKLLNEQLLAPQAATMHEGGVMITKACDRCGAAAYEVMPSCWVCTNAGDGIDIWQHVQVGGYWVSFDGPQVLFCQAAIELLRAKLLLESVVVLPDRATQKMRDNNLVMANTEYDPMQKLAFTFYSMMVGVSTLARMLLDGDSW